MDPIRSTAELYAHALAMEAEAADRYVELAVRMLDEGNREIAELFWKLGRAEGEHYAALLRKAAQMVLPSLPRGAYRWIDAGGPETAAQELVFRLMTPRHALAIALDAERRARDFFNAAARTAADPAVRALAREMAAEENEHIVSLLEQIERTPAPPDWEKLFRDKAA